MKQFSPAYADYLKSKEWNKIRQKRLKKDSYACQECGATNKPLDVHHKTYDRFGHERINDLVSLCRRCHEKEHEPKYEFMRCGTCGKILIIIIEKLRILGRSWTQYTCQDGHIRSYMDEHTNRHN